ncbi:MAG TPA: response regulator [Candidatus Eisenbacteria bacterium]
MAKIEAIRCRTSRPAEENGRLVLVVDDEESIRCVAWEILRYLGYGVETVASGQEAIERIEAGLKPDLVLLDMIMPGLGGVETFRRLREMEPTVRVVVATGFTDRTSADALAKEGVNGVLGKPFGIEALSRKLAEVFA